jgi:2-iminobutanoate/2-iminopropanoate deaminase
MQRRNFNSDSVARMSMVFPQAVVTDHLIFLSGMAGIDPISGTITTTDFEEQARQAFKNIAAVLEEAGSSLSKIVKTTIFMVAGNDFALINKVYSEVFPDNAPARSTPQVMPFPGGILISVECIATL